MDDSDHSNFQKHIKATQQAGDIYLTATVLPFVIQFSLLLLFYIFLWNQFWWIKWTLIFVLPFSIYNLYKIYLQKKYLQNKIEEMNGMINEWQEESSQ